MTKIEEAKWTTQINNTAKAFLVTFQGSGILEYIRITGE